MKQWKIPKSMSFNHFPQTPTANAKTTYSPLPVYILPTPAENPKPATPASKAKSNPLSAMQKFKELVAIAQIFATTSNKMATAYIAWHSGWFGCGFGFWNTPNLGISKFPPPPPPPIFFFVFNLFCLVLFYRILF